MFGTHKRRFKLSQNSIGACYSIGAKKFEIFMHGEIFEEFQNS